MKRVLAFVLACSFVVVAAPSAAAQDGAAATPSRRAAAEKDFQGQLNDVFGTLLGWAAFVPFYNIAEYLGLSTAPHLMVDASGSPRFERLVLRGHEGAVEWAVLSPAGDRLLTVGADNTARLWPVRPLDVHARAAEHEAEALLVLRASAAITAAAFFPDGLEVTLGLSNGGVAICDLSTPDGREVEATPVDASGAAVTDIAYSPDGAHLVIARADGTVASLDAQANTVARVRHDGEVTALAFAPDGALVLTGSTGGTAKMWQPQGSLVVELPRHQDGVTTTAWAADGSYALTASGAGDVQLWAPDGTAAGAAFGVGDRDRAAAAEFDATGDALRVATPAADPNKRDLWSIGAVAMVTEDVPASDWTYMTDGNAVQLARGDGSEMHRFAGHSDTLTSTFFAPDGSRLITTSADGTASVWEWLVRAPTGSLVSTNVPLVVLWLVVAAVLFTLYMRFVNLRMFGHAIRVVAGHYDDPDDQGEVSHFQALSSALSGTVGLGNIAGVAIAIMVGGPGATMWMIVAGLLGMTLKFTECTLGQRYRHIDAEGRVSGGPMHYLREGLSKRGFGFLGAPLAAIFMIFCIGGSLAGGNSFQVNQSLTILAERVPFFEDNGWIYGVVMAVLVGIVIIGGIRRIAQTAEKIVPAMCGLYLVASLTIIVFNFSQVPAAFGAIFAGAFSGEAMYGGALGALIMGFRRAAFSNEAGVGSASIAHSAARTPYPVREGIVALLEPFIDTVVVCTMTALVINITNVHLMPEHAELVAGQKGAALTSEAFQTVPFLAGWFPWVLMGAVVLFAFSTMITWSYYGERCWTHLFGQGASFSFKILFLVFVVLGSVIKATNILEFGDLMILLMAFPNILGLYFLGGEVKGELGEYEQKLSAGELKVYR
ncbi:MAG: amino acid carrier protein [Planctomycetota bacterium]